jgi:uncharacterized repeat protein (TIGR03803 family)
MTKKQVSGFCTLTMLILTIAAANTVAQAQFSLLYTFNNTNNSDPLGFTNPGTIAQGQDGNVYSTSENGGGVLNSGSFFRMTQTGTLSVLYAFDPNVDAGCSSPWSGLTLGTDGNFYGALESCGFGFGSGYVFSITPSGGLNLLYNFTGGGDGGQPIGTPVEGSDGNFYGTTLVGGGVANCGTIYQMMPSGSLTTLHTFAGTDGCGSYAPLVQGNDGNFYGVTTSGGSNGVGVVFKITPAGVYTVLRNFTGPNGTFPRGPLVLGSDGNFYGTTSEGGVGTSASGVAFKTTPTGKVTVLHTFTSDSGDGYSPEGMVQATDGNFYGVTSQGGTSPNCANGVNSVCGTIFRINSTGSSYAVLYNFDGTTGASPLITLLQRTNGIFYGLASVGGTYNSGTFYSLNVGLGQFVRLVSTSGLVGAPVEILGQGFTGTKKVSFGGASAAFTVVSDTYLTATVPGGAKTGNVTVTTPSTTLKSSTKFRVTPQMTNFNPTSGPVGTSVVITGVSLIQTSNVTFGGVKATTVTKNSNTQVTAIVPTGAKTGNIVITTAGGTATSSGIFTVTP